MTVERIRIEEPFFNAPAGSTLKLIHNTRMIGICDVCGNKKYCDWYEWDPEIHYMTGMDVCSSCSKRLTDRSGMTINGFRIGRINNVWIGTKDDLRIEADTLGDLMIKMDQAEEGA